MHRIKKVERYFNTAGPSVINLHYMIDPVTRIDLADVLALIDRHRYFVLHAPRQSGKTTTLLAWTDYINNDGYYHALYVDIEAAQVARHDVRMGITTVCRAIASRARDYGIKTNLEEIVNTTLAIGDISSALTEVLAQWARASDLPIVLILDEVDALMGDTLISVLRQIRAGYTQRPTAFPQSIILCGVHDVRDYNIQTSNHEMVSGGSAFNIKAESLRLGDLDLAEIKALYAQHTADTGQTFAPEIFPELWEDTKGQPWLVNALGYELTWKDRTLRNRSIPIDLESYREACQRLIHSHATHFDQFTEKLGNAGLKAVTATLLASSTGQFSENDLRDITDMGLIRRKPHVTIANRIYMEVLPREITAATQDVMVQDAQTFTTPERRLDVQKLFVTFQRAFRDRYSNWQELADYGDAGPLLLFQAFVQRIIDGTGRIHRDYGLAQRCTNMLIEWPLDKALNFHGPLQLVAIELKLLYVDIDYTLRDGLEQIVTYASQHAAEEAHLLIFHRNISNWSERIWHRKKQVEKCTIDIWGC